MSDFKLEVGMFVRFKNKNEIMIIHDTSKNTTIMFNVSATGIFYYNDIAERQYEVSYTYDFKEIIFSNIKKELLTEEEKEIVTRWVDVVGRENIESIEFGDCVRGFYFYININRENNFATSIYYPKKFKNIELDKYYTLEELGL